MVALAIPELSSWIVILLESLLVLGPGSWHMQLILPFLVRTCGRRAGGVHAARARGAERGAALAQVDLHGSGRVAAPEAAAVVVHAAARAAHLGARGFGGGQVLEGGAVRVAAAVLPRQLAPRCGHATRPRGDLIYQAPLRTRPRPHDVQTAT